MVRPRDPGKSRNDCNLTYTSWETETQASKGETLRFTSRKAQQWGWGENRRKRWQCVSRELGPQIPPHCPAGLEVYSVENVKWRTLSGRYQGTDEVEDSVKYLISSETPSGYFSFLPTFWKSNVFSRYETRIYFFEDSWTICAEKTYRVLIVGISSGTAHSQITLQWSPPVNKTHPLTQTCQSAFCAPSSRWGTTSDHQTFEEIRRPKTNLD